MDFIRWFKKWFSFFKNDWYSYHSRKARQLGIFDEKWYIKNNQGLVFSQLNSFMHYVTIGWKEGRDPSPQFNVRIYKKVAQDYQVGSVCPVIDAIQRIQDGRLKKEELKKIVCKKRLDNAFKIILSNGISLSGYIKSEIGLGQAARNLVKAVDSAGIPRSLHDFPLVDRNSDNEYALSLQNECDRSCNLLIIPIPEMPLHQHELRNGIKSILYPFWELPKIPDFLNSYVRRYDEIWVPSDYIAQMFCDCGRRTTLVRQPVPIPEISTMESKDSGNLNFLTYYDFDSSIARKNIKAPIIAFQRAFPNQHDVSLTIKVRGTNGGQAREWLSMEAVNDRRLRIIDSTLTRDEVNRLVLECDAFISLHRSEGFGFGAAEALAAGKAVIATDYSGTKDFITPETGYPVEYELVPVKEGEYPHWENQVWADPRIESAINSLRSIYSDRHGALEKGRKGRELMRRLYAPEVIGAQIKQLLIERGIIKI
jgi:glycosyltransferase involved in cell wall biosynthesis